MPFSFLTNGGGRTYFETAVYRSPFTLMRFFVVVIGLFGVIVALWAFGLIGMGGRDIVAPRETVSLQERSFENVANFLGGREDRIDDIRTDVLPSPFR